MQLIAVLGAQTLTLGDDYTFESAYQYILEQDSDPFDNPWLEGFDLILIDDENKLWKFECESWCPLDEEK